MLFFSREHLFLLLHFEVFKVKLHFVPNIIKTFILILAYVLLASVIVNFIYSIEYISSYARNDKSESEENEKIHLQALFSNTGVFFQKFGDPYQALYTIFEGNNDAWVPSQEVEVPYLEIAETSRFGSNISKMVRNVFIEKNDNFNSLNIIQSFNPYFNIYDSEKDLIEQYIRYWLQIYFIIQLAEIASINHICLYFS
ncbi:hypothetical protein [Peribacillus frigoritolerans]|uniref:hypothetical protein n=1 Tax=Peribacillus frigoritolerans TaxID=450367 RepID=UPI00207A2E1F|nr:hypothetical protein [Peribacillus frigoritolerans]USK67601.1 hypothetical protein LIT26_13925 [Peribacillus frigoritolerans]